MDRKMSQAFIDKVADLLWDCLTKSLDHPDRRHTGWGTKTKEGLAACVLRIVEEEQGDHYKSD